MSQDLLANHRILLKDKIRMEAYRQTIHSAIKSGMVVADVGAGLGVLAQMAIEAGAAKVYAIEFDADTIAHAAHAENIIWMHGLSGNIRLPEKVDVVVSETLGSFALDENILPTLIDARKRFLKKGGILIPQALELFVAPVTSASRKKAQLIPSAHWLAKPVSQLVDFYTATDPTYIFETTFKVIRDATLSGFSGWFNLHLSNKVSFSTGPDAPKTHWKQGFLPIRRPQKIRHGQTIHFQLVMKPDRLPTGVETIIEYDFTVSS